MYEPLAEKLEEFAHVMAGINALNSWSLRLTQQSGQSFFN
jgi:hypothetical protein